MRFDLEGNHGTKPSHLPEYDTEPSLFDIISADVDVVSEHTAERVNMEQSSSCDSSANAFVVGEKLTRAKEQARLREMRLRVPTVAGGAICTLCGYAYLLGVPLWAHIAGTWSASVGVLLLLCSLLPSDKRALPLAGALVFLPGMLWYAIVSSFAFFELLQNLQDQRCILKATEEYSVPCWSMPSHIIAEALSCIVTIVNMIRIILALIGKMSLNKLLATYWSVVGWCNTISRGALSVAHIVTLFGGSVENSILSVAALLPQFLVGLIALAGHNEFRGKVQSWFMSRSGSTMTAAGVAELLVGQSIKDLLVTARSTFRFVKGDRIAFIDIEDNQPNADLAVLTEKGRLGFVDAFVSHSWHDNAETKWIALQQLRDDFKKKESREPKLWIDKYSIDQNNIDPSLASLPVYIAGCKQLWILCGSTYLERLWCIIEIFVFIEMGGSQSNLYVKVLDDVKLRNSAKSLDRASQFDVRNALCSTDFDTERLHAVIEAAGYDKINELVSKMFFGRIVA